MNKPLYQPGEEVRYHGAKAKVLACINVGDTRCQGFRYYVTQGRWTWSAPEWAIDSVNDPKFASRKSSTSKGENFKDALG